jgi:hypothetical protein
MLQNGHFGNLLNPQTKGAYEVTDIAVYYLNGYETELAFRGSLDHPPFWEVRSNSVSGNYFRSVRAAKRRREKPFDHLHGPERQ